MSGEQFGTSDTGIPVSDVGMPLHPEDAEPVGVRRRGRGANGYSGGGGRGGVGAGRRRARRSVIWIGAAMALVTASTMAYAGYWWYRIDHNFTKAPLHAAATPIPGVVPATPDAFGNTPMNILVIGTDVRLPGKDATLGGFVDSSGRADVEMLVHVSADRTNATIVSLPRDTIVPIPACVDQKGNHYPAQASGMINSALVAGPGCQVDTIEQFTHVQIDHFMMVDFSGVVDLTNAVGGVDVCVTKAVHDPDSHLDLPTGTSQVEGAQALAFLRTREGFANGSDLYRTQAQHQYLSSLIRKLKGQATLDNPTQALHLADVASKSLTMDPGIAGVSKLLDLANTLKKVPSAGITFLTMPTTAYRPDPNRVAPDQGLDDQIFSLIAHDQSVSAPTQAGNSSPSSSPSPTSSAGAVDLSSVKETVVVENGTVANGRSKQVADVLKREGLKNGSWTGYPQSDVATTSVFYSTGHQDAAKAVASALRLPASAVRPGGDGSGQVVVRVGSDSATGDAFGGSVTPSVPLPSSVASSANAETADNAGLCVQAYGG
jgi:LCP family protein required for cell wall assembly